jgi:iron-sulfur cluster assembly accessory protein
MTAVEDALEIGPEASAAGPAILLTEKAAERIKSAMQREGVSGYGVRIGVVGGGCSGFQYQLSFEEHPGPEDVVWQLSGVRVFVDVASSDHLRGVTLDWVAGLHAAGFKFINPNASRTCGCGSSFGM